MMNYQKTSIIFGGTGFIGSALACKLASQGERVISISRHIPEKKENGVEYFAVDLEFHSEELRNILISGSSIFLLTGQVYAGFDQEKEKIVFQKILDEVKLSFPEKIIFTSSALVYGDCEIPATEESDLSPRDTYSSFKIECEQIIQRNFPDIPVGILRLANVYGSEKNKGFIGLVFKKALAGEAMKVNGDGLQERDYIFLDDVIEAMVAVRNGLNKSDVINIATTKSSTLIDVISFIGEVSGKDVSYEVTGIPIDEIRISRISSVKLKEKYSFEARVSLLDGLQKTWVRYQQAL